HAEIVVVRVVLLHHEDEVVHVVEVTVGTGGRDGEPHRRRERCSHQNVADPDTSLHDHLPAPSSGRTFCIDRLRYALWRAAVKEIRHQDEGRSLTARRRERTTYATATSRRPARRASSGPAQGRGMALERREAGSSRGAPP